MMGVAFVVAISPLCGALDPYPRAYFDETLAPVSAPPLGTDTPKRCHSSLI